MAYIGNNLDSDIQVNKYEYTATAGQTTFACTYDRAVDVYLNGVKLDSSDFTATNGTAIVLASGANVGDIVDINAYFDVTYANFYTQAEADARFMDINEETLPTQTGQSGKFLTTNGTAASWGTVDLTDLNPTTFTVPNYSSAPSSPSAGDMYYNTNTKIVSHWDGNKWVQVSNTFSASGGNATYTYNGYQVHVFTSSGTFTADASGSVDILVVAGGGGGGNNSRYNGAWAGGGGAGGLIFSQGVSVAPGNHSITIGAGGGTQSNGANSVALSLTAIGGGGGAGTQVNGYAGGSGGGARGDDPGTVGGTGTSGQGNNGGAGQDPSPEHGGGGGGAGEAGNTDDWGFGGDGLNMSTYFGTSYGESGYFAGGGAGGSGTDNSNSTNEGGLGGGGDSTGGYQNTLVAYAGAPNTGGGGAGLNAGGSGIVIIRYAI